MKKILSSLLVICSLVLIPLTTHAENDEAVLAALGATAAQSVMVTYFGINTLGDAYTKKTYDKEQAGQILSIYKNTTVAAKSAIEKAMKTELSDDDKAALKFMADTYGILIEQATALEEYIKTGDESAASKFEESRKEAQVAIDKLTS